MPKIKIAPSILSSDFGKLNEEIREVESYSDLIHVDVMDGHFVPNITIGPSVVKYIKTKLPLDVHLMISEPLKYAPEYSKYCQRISFHPELFDTPSRLEEAIRKMQKLGVEVGLALNPDKPISFVTPVLKQIDYILIMSVYAGFGGQKFIPEVLQKIKELRQKYNYKKDIEIDGGINEKTAKLAVDAGANILISGSYIFDSKDRKKAIETLKKVGK